MDAVIVTGSVDLASSPDDLWPLITDTDRMNRLLGLGPVKLRPIDGDGSSAARFVVETSAAGFQLEYEEFPFEWSHGRHLRVYRRMRRGPLSAYTLVWQFERASVRSGGLEGGTRAHLRLELVPRYGILRPVAWFEGNRVVANLKNLARAIDAHVREKAPSPFLKPVSQVDEGHLGYALTELEKSGVDAPMAARFGEFLRGAADADLVRIRPYDLADQWGQDRQGVLRAMLHGVPAGLLELRWAIICPSCLTASEQYRALQDITAEGHCQLCDISFDLDLDRAVEATFLPHPSVRAATDQLFCVGGPARTPHVLSQVNVEAGEERDVDVPVAAGRFRLFARGGGATRLEVEEGAPPRVDVTLEAAGLRPAEARVSPGGVVHVKNATDEGRHVKVERLLYTSAAATAHAVSTLPEFRSLFSSELLKRSTPLKVARVAILFSDLTGSTALYSKVGDAAAFRLVDDHFDVVRGAVADAGGVVVKTMGDAVMAAFQDNRAAVHAAVETLRRFEVFRSAANHGEHVGIKLGIHTGACYVVTANGQLDYFGQTVNVASRVQHLAEAGELVVAHEHLEVADLGSGGIRITDRFEARVKGVDAPLALARLRLEGVPGVAGRVESGPTEVVGGGASAGPGRADAAS